MIRLSKATTVGPKSNTISRTTEETQIVVHLLRLLRCLLNIEITAADEYTKVCPMQEREN
jgi:hypothetical protein